MIRKLVSAALACAFASATAALPARTAAADVTECQPGWRGVSFSDRTVRNSITHAEVIHVAPHSGFHQREAVTKHRRIGAGIDGTFTASGGADWVIARADASMSVSLHASGEWTRGRSISRRWDINNNSSKQRNYVLFYGTKVVRGRYHKRVCSSDGRSIRHTYGRFQSWVALHHGTALCGYDYRAGSMDRKATRYC